MIKKLNFIAGGLIFYLLFLCTAYSAPKGLVSLSDLDSTIQIRMAYSNHRNFSGRQFYKKNRCYLLPSTAKALVLAQKKALELGLSLLVLDCYRPHPVSRQMWHAGEQHNSLCRQKFGKQCKQGDCNPARPDCAWVPLTNYLSRLSNHSRGTAVDLTLVRLAEDGISLQELDMGTAYDAFSPLSRTRAARGQALENRLLLKRLMHSAGFKNYFREWWHYDFGPKNAFPVRGEPIH